MKKMPPQTFFKTNLMETFHELNFLFLGISDEEQKAAMTWV